MGSSLCSWASHWVDLAKQFYTYIYTHKCMLYIHINIHTCICTYIYMSMRVFIYVCIYLNKSVASRAPGGPRFWKGS